MTVRKNRTERTIDQTAWPWDHRDAFLERLRLQGYSHWTLRQYESATRNFCTALEKPGLGSRGLDVAAVARLKRSAIGALPEYARNWGKFCMARFIEYLAEGGAVAVPQPPAKKLTARERLHKEYEAYLRRQRGLAEGTVRNSLYYGERFLTFRFGEKAGDLKAITPDDIVAFLCKLKAGSSARRCKALPSHLRTFFKFLFFSGKTKRDLAQSLPRVATAANNLPRHLEPEAVERLIKSVRTGDAIGRRNYAMLLLMGRFGLRAPELVAMQLDDIDWRAGEILIRGKGKLHDRMPLPAEVGEAIVDYIRNGRAGSSRALFVSERGPHIPFKDGQIVNTVLREAFKQTGLKPPQKWVGSHLMRHSLATDMLHKGASLNEIGDVLRHRSRKSTMIYAKYDIDALRSIARPWPAGGDVR